MDNFDSVNSNDAQTSQQEPSGETELSHTDKMAGVFTEPSETFRLTSLFPPKTIDWFLPVLILLVVVAITNILMMNDPQIRMQAQEKQIEQIQKNLDEAVEKGQMTQEQADQQMERIRDQMASMGLGTTMIISTVGVFIVGFIFVFFMSLIYFLFARFVFKDTGSYTSALVANGLTAYISIIQVVLAAVLAILFGRLMNDVSLAALLGSDRTTFLGWVFAKIDPISIWAYAVLSIGLAKMFKSQSTGKYYALVFGIWLIGGLLLFLLAQALPFLKMFGL